MNPARPRCSVYIAISADGFIARKDGSLDWLSVVARAGEDYGYATFMESVDALVVGRKTYETALSFETWPYAGKRCVVLTHGPAVARHDEAFFSGDASELLATLFRDGVRHVYVDGGQLIRSFLAQRLVDDLTLSIVPVLLGDGVTLFGGDGIEHSLKLTASEAFDSGLVQLRYALES